MFNKALIGAVLVMGIVVVMMWRSNLAMARELGQARQSIDQAEITNGENLMTISDLRTNLVQCMNEKAIDEMANKETVRELEESIKDLEEAEPQTRIIREEIFREPSCEELGAIDIAGVCPALASSLRERADRLSQN